MEPSKPYSPSPFDASLSSTHDAVNAAADSVATGIDNWSDAGHQALERSRDRAAAATDWATETAETIDRNGSEASQALRDAVRNRPLTAIGVAAAIGYLLVRIAR